MARARLERAFALATAGLLVLSLLTVAASGSQPPADDLAFEPEVPDTDAFAAPTADGTATVDGERYERLQAAVDAADPGDTVRLDGRFGGTVVVDTPNVTLAGSGADTALLDGDGEGTVLTVRAPGVTVRDLWVRNSGYSAADNDAAL